MSKVRIGIIGYGNIGRGVEAAIKQNPDCEMAGVFTRRDPATVKITTEGGKVYPVSELTAHKDDIDVCIVCGGSATDLPKQTPEIAKMFNVVDSFDTHARIPEHFANVDKAAQASGHYTEDREQHAQNFIILTQALLDIVHRAAGSVAVFIIGTILNCQNALGIFGSHTEEGCQPHPEQCAGTAKLDCRSNTNDVAGTNSCG